MLRGTAVSALLISLCLTGCARPPSTVDLKYLSQSLPETSCAAEPVVPATDTDAGAAQYWLDVLMAGRDCREKLAADVGALGKQVASP